MDALRLAEGDQVVVALAGLEPGPVDLRGVAGIGRMTVLDPIPRGHKLAIADVAAGEPVRKYGQVIGYASRPITAGQHVHLHNLAFDAVRQSYDDIGVDARPTSFVDVRERAIFNGIRRSNGQAATRNYIGVLTTVNCSATAAKLIAGRFVDVREEQAGVDGVVALTHDTGCGMDGPGSEAFDMLRRTLAGYAGHPNFAGFVVLGLGCEINQLDSLIAEWDIPDDKLVVPMTIQEAGGTRKAVSRGVDQIRELLPQVGDVQREPIPAAELVLGMECGGSDAYSGITANPALGAAADLLVEHGGIAAFGETPEIYGAEHLLARRARTKEVGERLIERIRWWEEYTRRHGGSMDNNPAPGNKEGGITTILEKSLGAAAKGGSTDLCDVVEYAVPLRTKGMVFMDTPGYDPVSATGLVAGGATVLCFTTGRGSAFGCSPTPSIKIATSTELYERMGDDMDLDAGPIVTGERTVEEVGRVIFDRILAVASGERTLSEELGYGSEEFVPWQLGAVM